MPSKGRKKKDEQPFWGLGLEHEVVLFGPVRMMSREQVLRRFLAEGDVEQWGRGLGWDPTFLEGQLRTLAKRARLPVLPRFNDFNTFFDDVLAPAVDKDNQAAQEDGAQPKQQQQQPDGECPKMAARWRAKLAKLVASGAVTQAQLASLHKHISGDFSNLGPLPEVVSLDFKRATVRGVVGEVAAAEALLMRVLSTLTGKHLQPCAVGVWPLVLMDRPLFDDCPRGRQWIAPDYCGSYHVNITLPVKVRSEFMPRHMLAALVLQWCEPVLMAVLGQPDPFSILDSWQATEASFRMATNEYSAMGTQNVSSVAQLRSPALKARSANMPNTGGDMAWVPGGSRWLSRAAIAAAQYYDPPPYLRLVRAEQSAYGRRYNVGADFRRDQKEPFGFEYRVLDHVPLDRMADIVHVLLLICDHSAAIYDAWRTARKKHGAARVPPLDQQVPDPRHNPDWNSLAREVFLEGHNAGVPMSQRMALSQALALSEPAYPGRPCVTAWEVFRWLVDTLWGLYGGGKGAYTRYMCPGMPRPRVPNMNEAAWAHLARAWGVTAGSLAVHSEEGADAPSLRRRGKAKKNA